MRRKGGERGRLKVGFLDRPVQNRRPSGCYGPLPASAESTQAGPQGVGVGCYRLFSKGTEEAGVDSGPILRLCLRSLACFALPGWQPQGSPLSIPAAFSSPPPSLAEILLF